MHRMRHTRRKGKKKGNKRKEKIVLEREERDKKSERCVLVLSVAWRHFRLTAHGLKRLGPFWFRTAAVILIAPAVYDITHTPR